MMGVLQSLFSNKLDEDVRVPVTTLHIPGVEGTFGVFAPDKTLWLQLGAVSA
jgi:hypothetical protein